jgi:two-component system nitrate/nitrite response regulator NarL
MPESEIKKVQSQTRVRNAGEILVLCRDAFSSDLLATALRQSLGCIAASVSISSLSKAIASGKAGLAIVSADLSGMPGEGFALASSISHTHPDTAIIVLLNEVSPEAVVRAFRSGASGVFCQEDPMTELLHCIEHVDNGLIWAGKKASAAMLDLLRNIPPSGTLAVDEAGESLTTRELQVVQCAATGKTNKSIAAQLHLSEHTVKNYLFRAFAKLGVSSRVELLFYLSSRGQLERHSSRIFNGSALTNLSSNAVHGASRPSSPSASDGVA